MAGKDRLRIVMLAAEAAPYAKVGGLGDVLGALPKALEKLGATVAVMIPHYPKVRSGSYAAEPWNVISGFDVAMGAVAEHADIRQTGCMGQT
jgi:starch synthase